MKIEFEGSYDKKTIRKKTALAEQPSRKFLIRQIFLVIFLALILAFLVVIIYQSKKYFSSTSFFAVVLLFFIYYVIQPYIAPYLAVIQSSIESKETSFRRGTISSEGIKYISKDNVETIPWNTIYRAKQTDNLIILFVEYSPSIAFPRSFFKNEGDWRQFRRWVDFYIKDR
jgi:hypothetical protein